MAELPIRLIRDCNDGLVYCLFSWANTATGGAFAILILLGFSIVAFMATQRYGTPRAFGFASFVGMVGAIFLAISNLLIWEIASAFILVGVIGIAVLILNER